MKLKSIKLVNFQAHSELEVGFSPGITTIIGPTDQGKSAVLRALGWCCLNDIAGDEFIKQGSKKTSVHVTAQNKDGEESVIGRTRSKGGAINKYEIEGEELKSFGQGTPQPVQDLLALGPINFQKQHDPPFWFCETAGEVSRQLNAVIDLTVIDSSLAYVSSLVRENQLKEKLGKERVDACTQELESYEPSRQRIKDFKKLKALQKSYQTAKDKQDKLEFCIHVISSNRSVELQEKAEHITMVFGLAKAAYNIAEQADDLSKRMSKAVKLGQRSKPPDDFSEIEMLHHSRKLTAAKLERSVNSIRKAEVAMERLADAKKRLSKAEEKFHSKIKGEKCPLCESLIE